MQKQSGFAVLEALLIVIVLALIGGTGYYVWHSRQSTDTVLQGTRIVNDSSSATKTAKAKSTVVKKVTFAALPSALQNAAVKQAPDCYNGQGVRVMDGGNVDTSSDVYYISNRAAMFATCSAVSIFAYDKGAWVHVSTGQDSPNCANLQKYAVPASLLVDYTQGKLNAAGSAECFDANNKAITYSQS